MVVLGYSHTLNQVLVYLEKNPENYERQSAIYDLSIGPRDNNGAIMDLFNYYLLTNYLY